MDEAEDAREGRRMVFVDGAEIELSALHNAH
jgi:hypothetical protein